MPTWPIRDVQAFNPQPRSSCTFGVCSTTVLSPEHGLFRGLTNVSGTEFRPWSLQRNHCESLRRFLVPGESSCGGNAAVIPQSHRSTCTATRTSNPPIYHYSGGREGGPETRTLSTGGYCQSGNRSGRSHSHQHCRIQTTRLPFSSLSCLHTGFKIANDVPAVNTFLIVFCALARDFPQKKQSL